MFVMFFYYAGVNKRDIKSFSSDDIFDCGFKKMYLFFLSISYQKCACEIQDTLRSKILPSMPVMLFMRINPSSMKFGNSVFLGNEHT